MKRIGLIAIAVIFLGMPELQAKVIGQFQVVKGTVHLVSKRGRKKKAKYGMRVKEGQTVLTAKDSRAKVVMLDKNVIYISPDSRMKFGKYNQKVKKSQETVLDVVYGKIRTKVKQKYDDDKAKFRVQTKAAVAGVRGTDFLSGYNQQKNQADFVTFEGTIQVGLIGPDGNLTNVIEVQPGEYSSFGLGETPENKGKLPESKWDQEKSGSQVEGGSDEYDPSLKDDSDQGGSGGEGPDDQGGSGGEGSGGKDGDYGDDSFGGDAEVGADELEDLEGELEGDADVEWDEVEDYDFDELVPEEDLCGEICEELPETTNLIININLQD